MRVVIFHGVTESIFGGLTVFGLMIGGLWLMINRFGRGGVICGLGGGLVCGGGGGLMIGGGGERGGRRGRGRVGNGMGDKRVGGVDNWVGVNVGCAGGVVGKGHSH